MTLNVDRSKNIIGTSNDQQIAGSYSELKISADGSTFAVLDDAKMIVYSQNHEELYCFVKEGLFDVVLSSTGKYAVTIEHILDSSTPNCFVHDVQRRKIITSHFVRMNTWPVQFSCDETVYGLIKNNKTLSIYQMDKLFGEIKADQDNTISSFTFSPSNPPIISVFSPEHKGLPASIRLYRLDNLQVPISMKTFFKAQRVRLYWNIIGNCAVVLTSVDHDKSNKSYYGESKIYFMSSIADWCGNVRLDKEGPIHDVCWSPTSREFAVCYGFMPAKSALFSTRAIQTFDFGTLSRNTLSFSPTGRFLIIAGFGNLSGDLDIWDMATYKKLKTISVPNVTRVDWSPDGRYVVASTLSPRMRVDNGYKIIHYRGVCVEEKKIDNLYQVFWVPKLQPDNFYSSAFKRELSPPPRAVVSTEKVVTGQYIPPSARRGIPGANFVNNDAKKKTITRKLQIIQNIKAKLAAGQEITESQRSKILEEQMLSAELESLSLQ